MIVWMPPSTKRVTQARRLASSLAHDVVEQKQRTLAEEVLAQAHLSHLPGQGHGALLALTPVRTGIAAVYLEYDVVSVRPVSVWARRRSSARWARICSSMRPTSSSRPMPTSAPSTLGA